MGYYVHKVLWQVRVKNLVVENIYRKIETAEENI